MAPPTLVVIAGPTAVGKTELSIQLAKQWACEILSADSRQFYQEISIGTARPLPEEWQGVPHHFLGFLPLETPYTAGRYEQEALALLEKLFTKNDRVILTGGSGLFLKAVCAGIDPMPEIDAEVREKLNHRLATESLSVLFQELEQLDPEYAAVVDRQNPRRVLRGLEVVKSCGIPYSSFRKAQPKKRPFQMVGLCLDRPRAELHARINQRVDAMVAAGLEAEARSVYPKKDLNSLQTVGYREWFEHFDGNISKQEAIEKIKAHTRQFARRQLTWFRNDPFYQWFHPDDQAGVAQFLASVLSKPS
ncbi:MAG: tRNA (adenosine(37)-N6)-dimethylallyltransferase MiaA [Salibacteraceae bacterium]